MVSAMGIVGGSRRLFWMSFESGENAPPNENSLGKFLVSGAKVRIQRVHSITVLIMFRCYTKLRKIVIIFYTIKLFISYLGSLPDIINILVRTTHHYYVHSQPCFFILTLLLTTMVNKTPFTLWQFSFSSTLISF